MSETMELELVDAPGGKAPVPVERRGIPTPMALIEQAVAAGNLDMVEKLMTLQERWDRTQARKAFDAAMAKAKAEIPVIIKNRTVDFTGKTGIRTHYKHEDLGEIARTIDPILARHGLSYRYRTSSLPNEPICVTCIISHADGHYEENSLTGPREESGNKNPHQAIASAITLFQRYTLKAALGLAAGDDDDGRAAGNGESGMISEEQHETLRQKIVDAGADLPKFLKTYGIDQLADLPASKYDDAYRKLTMKAARAVKPAETAA